MYSIFTLQTVSAFEDTVSGKLSTLVHVVIPLVDFNKDTTFEEAIDFLNLRVFEVDPPQPKSWEVVLDVDKKYLRQTVPMKHQDISLYALLGEICDVVGADLIISRKGFIIRKRDENKAEPDTTGNQLPDK